MSLIDDLRNAKRHEVVTAVVFFIGAVAPGIMVLNAYSPESIKDLDVVKLTLLSLGLTMPIILLNTVVAGKDDKSGDRLLQDFGFANLVSSIVFYIPLLVGLFVELSKQFFIVAAAGMEVVVILILLKVARASSGEGK